MQKQCYEKVASMLSWPCRLTRLHHSLIPENTCLQVLLPRLLKKAPTRLGMRLINTTRLIASDTLFLTVRSTAPPVHKMEMGSGDRGIVPATTLENRRNI